MYRIILKKGRGESLKRYHPWVFSGAVGGIERVKSMGGKRMYGGDTDELKEGEIVEVQSFEGDFLGIGHYQIGTIAVRILSFERCAIDEKFWYGALKRAYDMRVSLFLTEGKETNAYRLVHGEGDFLPGLIIDLYGDIAVMQAHSVGMFLAEKDICLALKKIYGDSLKAVYDKSSGTAPFKAGLEVKDSYIYRNSDMYFEEEKSSSFIIENGNKFSVNWVEGQKTGFFLDQRENRELVKKYSQGRNVLNLFCYTGGFSVYALAGGAVHVDSVDSSQKAIDLAVENVTLNGFKTVEGDDYEKKSGGESIAKKQKKKDRDNDKATHSAYCTDAIEFLHKTEKGKYDLMIVDPPAFAKHRGAMQNALRAYKRLNAAAIERVAPGGIIFTFSCSQVVDKNEFALAVFSAAAQSGRRVRILYRLTQPQDHPVNIYHPEGEYLKGLVLFVE
jgi:23S rRNA (cytosine1962-C5)-methyltransferase